MMQIPWACKNTLCSIELNVTNIPFYISLHYSFIKMKEKSALSLHRAGNDRTISCKHAKDTDPWH